jgi:hypothetical protein
MKTPNWLKYTGITALVVFLLGLISSVIAFLSGKDGLGSAMLIAFFILPTVGVFVFLWLVGLLTNFLISKRKHNTANIIIGILLIISLIILAWLVVLPTIPFTAKIIFAVSWTILPAFYFVFLLSTINR